jgi:hypothetical protein
VLEPGAHIGARNALHALRGGAHPQSFLALEACAGVFAHHSYVKKKIIGIFGNRQINIRLSMHSNEQHKITISWC